MKKITLQSTIEEILETVPASAGKLERLGIDICCGGKSTLSAACLDRGIEADSVLETLTHGSGQEAHGAESGETASGMSPSELADHIEKIHHAKLWSELERLEGLSAKVVRAHGDKDPRLALLRESFLELAGRFTEHMRREEEVLFPLIRQIDAAHGPTPSPMGSVANPISAMEADHEEASVSFLEMRQLSDDYAVPPWACRTYAALMNGLSEMERDMQVHIREESELLYPAVLKLESGR